MSTTLFLEGAALISLALSLAMAIAWLVWRATHNSGWIDTVWTFSLGAIGACSAIFLAREQLTFRAWLVAAMALLWALRLGLHIANRTAGITDDPRYAKLTMNWGPDASRQMFWLLQKQALVSIPLALAMWLASQRPQVGVLPTDIIGIAFFTVAIIGEAIADEQLRRFRTDSRNKDRVCDTGLWKWSRHPNYFFEWLGWLAYPLLAIDLGGGYPWGFLALGAPACMYWLLVYISGVPPLEAHMLERHGDEFRQYQLRTNVFFPGPPKVIVLGG
jgi:steroid 5-alpha reductase family enzyme